MKLLRVCRFAKAFAAVTALLVSGMASAAEQSVFKQIQDRGELRIGVAHSIPWYDKNPLTGEWSGYCHEVGRRMANDLGVDLKEVEVTWGNSIAALQAKKIDMMACLDGTPKRAMAVDFSTSPIMYIALSLLVDDDIKADNWDQLNRSDFSVAVTQGSSIDEFISRILPKANILRFPSNAENVAAFQSKRVNASALYFPPLMRFQAKLGRGNLVTPSPVFQNPSSIAVRKEADKSWRDWVNTASAYYYGTQQVQQWFATYLDSHGFDSKKVPSVVRELW